MLHHFLADAAEAGEFGKIGDVAVHVAVHLDVFHHLAAVGLQPAVEVVKVVYAAHTARRGVEKLGGYGLRQRVVALLLIAAHDVVAFLAYHAVEFRNLVRRILQVGVHGDNHVAFGAGEAHVQRRAFSIIASETHTAHGRVGLGQTLYHLPGTVGTAVVHEYYLIAEAVVAHHTGYPLLQFRKRFGFVVQRHYY